MKSTKKQNTFIIRLEKDEKIIESLTQFCEENNIKAGSFHGLGACEEATLAHYNLETKEYTEKTLKQPLEILHLNGNISEMEGKPYLHVHIVLSDTEMKALGGHLKEAIVGPTCEIFLTPLENAINRKKDKEIGLNLLDM
ncbi:MAG: DNA-binding protein [Candidatus Woesearchaeota archaeon]|jgi:hypothetical protein|nr:DNA-binding protein [Candidatus Woesearchaeota archaeon]MDP7180200.1 DNA-binding protein [Candidatus Woesearchaeota archaeon]MDP7458135.1 DNA-binding protein [Candidatus Woesearchaeota archaeon]